MLLIRNIGIYAAEAAPMATDSHRKVVPLPSSSAQSLARAVVPISGILWPAGVGRMVGSRRLGGLMAPLRNSMLTQVDYNRSAQLWKDAFFNDETRSPNGWEARRTRIERFDMDDSDPMRVWAHVAHRCASRGFSYASMSDKASQAKLNNLLAGEDVALLARLLRRTSVFDFSAPPHG